MAADSTSAPPPAPAGVYQQRVVAVRHYTPRLFMFRITRPADFRFRSGEFVMIGLPGGEKPDKPLFRAYSIASPAWDETLEFYSIKVPGGPLTEKLRMITPGDAILMRRKATGTLVGDALLPGRRLFLFSTGTGIAPFAALIRDPEIYRKFAHVVLTHSCRRAAALRYGQELAESLPDDPLVGEVARSRFRYFPTLTREDFPQRGRITELVQSGALFTALGIPPIMAEEDRAMICGSMGMLKDMAALLEGFGLHEGAVSKPGAYVVERAFVE